MLTLLHHTRNKHGQKTASRGFTIVELLVVIIVIAILAAVTVVAYNGIQARALNTKVLSSVNGSLKLLNLYYAEYSAWPQEAPPGKQAIEYCLGKDYALASAGATSTYDSPTVRTPRRWCFDYGSSGRFESDWLPTTLGKYGTLPGATTLQDYYDTPAGVMYPKYAPIYGVSYPGFVLMWANIAGLTYPVVNGVTQNGSAHYITYALKGDVASCGITNAQRLIPGTYDGNTVCIIMLEFFGA